MSSFALSSAALLVFALLCVVSLADRPSSAALSENDHVSKDSVHLAWDNDAAVHDERIDKDEHLDGDADRQTIDDENEVVLEQSDRSWSYKCPNKCRPGWKGKKLARYECKRSKCYNSYDYKYYKCVVKSCKYKVGYYYRYGWWCTCPY